MGVGKLLISQGDIAVKVDHMAALIASRLDGSSTIMVGLLNGSVVFLSDMMRSLSRHGLCPLVDFMIVSSYKDATGSSGKVDIEQDVRIDLKSRTVLLVDDIVDTGRTLAEVRNHIYAKGAMDVITCALLDKPSRRVENISPDYTGFTIDDVFVVGYGLDAGNKYRCLPYIAVLEE